MEARHCSEIATMIEIESMQRMCCVKLDRQRRQSDQDLRLLLGHITILEAVDEKLLQRSAFEEYDRLHYSIPTIRAQQTSPSNRTQRESREMRCSKATHIEVVERYDDRDDDEEFVEDLEDDHEHALTRVHSHLETLEFGGEKAESRSVLVIYKCQH